MEQVQGEPGMHKQIRRVVTGHDASGRSTVLSDGPAPFVHLNEREPEFRSTDIWRTFETPARIVARVEEPTLGPRRQLPTPNGSVLRVNRFPPESASVAAMTPEESAGLFAALGNPDATASARHDRHPLMHRTETVDYAIVLSGEITMVLDDQDLHLSAGDIVVQCGTNHAWSNRSKEPCVIAFILIDGQWAAEPGQSPESASTAE
jgi:mannose-6-phosphate isomerase-like protein (cupin superfamily)